MEWLIFATLVLSHGLAFTAAAISFWSKEEDEARVFVGIPHEVLENFHNSIQWMSQRNTRPEDRINWKKEGF
jgi:hypothetical protein